MDKIRRINIFAGPGTGKSTAAAYLFYKFKKDFTLDKPTPEYVQEYIKEWAWQKRSATGFDQIHIFGKQILKEETVLKNDNTFVITDSPIFLQTVYAHEDIKNHLRALNFLYDEQYPPINILLHKSSDKVYNPNGRFQTKEEAEIVHDKIVYDLYTYYKNIIEFREDNLDNLYSIIKSRL